MKKKIINNKVRPTVAPVSYDDKIKSHTDKLVYDLNKIGADSMGLTVEEYLDWRKKTLKARNKYNKDHWVAPLTDGQVFTILYQKETKPYFYMGQPVSKENEFKIDRYKEFNKGWKEYKAKQAKKKSAFESMQLPKEIQAAGKQYRDMMEQVNKTLEPLKIVRNKIKSWGNPFSVQGFEYNTPIGSKGGLLDSDMFIGEKNRLVKKADTGLETYRRNFNLKNGVEIAEHWLANNTPTTLQYSVVNFDSIEALADTIGILPSEAFEILCLYIKKSRTKYLKRIYEKQNQILIEQLVNHYISEKQRRESKGLNALTKTKFYKSEYVQNFLKKFPTKLDAKRFSDKLETWVKIYTSTAKKVN